MKVSQFINGYKATTKDKETYVKGHIVNDYISYIDKISMAQRIVSSTSYVGDTVKVFKVNTPAKQVLFILSMIEKYTDIEIDWSKTVEEFDELCKCGVLGMIMKLIPESEATQCSSILDMVYDDEIMNNRDLVSFLETKFKSAELALSSLLETFNSEQIQNLLAQVGSQK